jgi:hypothetical protein
MVSLRFRAPAALQRFVYVVKELIIFPGLLLPGGLVVFLEGVFIHG